MRRRLLPLAPLVAAGCVLTSPGVAVTKSDPSFKLAQLAGQRVAVWPVAAARVDPAAVEGVTDGYGSQDAFLDAVARTLSLRLVRAGGAPSLRSDEVVARLGASDATRALLDSRRLLGTGESRFSARAPELATLGAQPSLDGVRYAVMFPELQVDLEEQVGGTKETGPMHMKWARGHLRTAVVDLRAGRVLWDGELAASGMLTGGGMKQIEEGLGAALDDAMGTRPAPPAQPRCQTQADCALGVCISGACR